MSFFEELAKETSPDDFKPGSLLRLIADHNITLAIKVAKNFGGERLYIPGFTHVTKDAQDRIVSRETGNQ